MFQLLMPRKSTRPSALRVLINRVSATAAEFRAPVPAAPAVVEPDTSEFFTEADMPPAEDIVEAARLYFRAADEARTADRAKRKAKKILDRLRAGRYGDWEVYREPSGRQTVDLDEVRRIFKAHNLGPVPMRSSADSLKVRRVELDLQPEVAESEFAVLAAAMTR